MNREEGMTGDRSKGKPGKRGEHSEQGDDNLKCIALRCFRELSHTVQSSTLLYFHYRSAVTSCILTADQTAVL